MGCLISQPTNSGETPTTPPPRTCNPSCLNSKIINCQIMSSHNTYLSGFQVGISHIPDAILNTIDNGFRCIELDVSLRSGTLTVGHTFATGTGPTIDVSSTIPLFDCLDIIKGSAFKKFNTPLFICIEDCTNGTYPIINSIKEYLGPTTIFDNFTESSFGNLTINQLLGKIVILDTSYKNYVTNLCSDSLNVTFGTKPVRIYPIFDAVTIFSSNPQTMLDFLSRGANFVAINSNCRDAVYNGYIQYFDKYNIIPL